MEKFEKLNIQSNSKNFESNYDYAEIEDDLDEDNKSTELNEPNVKETKSVNNINSANNIQPARKNNLFNNMNIFVEIFNNGINQSDCVIPILEEYGANICKKISKSTSYIIFKDGRKKVIQKALDNEVKLINPLWVHDCTTNKTLLNTENYRIKKTYTELLLENRKRRYNDVVLNTTKSLETPGKKRKVCSRVGSTRDFISPVVLDKENKTKSENVTIKSNLKIQTREGKDNQINKDAQEGNIKKSDNNPVNINTVLQESDENLNNSVFGNNIRCFKDTSVPHIQGVSKFITNNTGVRNNENNLKVYHRSSIKLRPAYTNFTPLNENKTKPRLLFKIPEVGEIKEIKDTEDVKEIKQVNQVGKVEEVKKLEEVKELNDNDNDDNKILNISKKRKSMSKTKLRKSKSKSISKSKSKSKSKTRNNLQNLIKNTNINSNIFRSRNTSNTSNISNLNNSHTNNNVNINIKPFTPFTTNLDTVAEHDSTKQVKTMARSVSKRVSQTTAKVQVRKLLLINSPDKEEVRNNEKFTLESIQKAINDDKFQNFDNNNTSSGNLLNPLNNCNNNFNNINNVKISIASIGLNDLCKTKIKAVLKSLNNIQSTNGSKTPSIRNLQWTYLGENYSDLEESEYIVIKQAPAVNFNKDIKILFICLLNHNIINSAITSERKFLRYQYFLDSEKKKKLLPVDNYIVKFSIDFELIDRLRIEDKLPLKGYKIFLHPNCYSTNEQVDKSLNENSADENKHDIFSKIVAFLGGCVVNNIRLSDLCVINKVESSQYFPPHVRNLNQDFVYDTLSNLKLPDLENFKYKPKDGKYKKNRK